MCSGLSFWETWVRIFSSSFSYYPLSRLFKIRLNVQTSGLVQQFESPERTSLLSSIADISVIQLLYGVTVNSYIQDQMASGNLSAFYQLYAKPSAIYRDPFSGADVLSGTPLWARPMLCIRWLILLTDQTQLDRPGQVSSKGRLLTRDDMKAGQVCRKDGILYLARQ